METLAACLEREDNTAPMDNSVRVNGRRRTWSYEPGEGKRAESQKEPIRRLSDNDCLLKDARVQGNSSRS